MPLNVQVMVGLGTPVKFTRSVTCSPALAWTSDAKSMILGSEAGISSLIVCACMCFNGGSRDLMLVGPRMWFGLN